MADKIYLASRVVAHDAVLYELCKVDMLGGPWVVNVDPVSKDGFNATHGPSGMACEHAHRLRADQARACADALNRHARFYTMTKVMQQRHVIEAICAATLEGDQV